MKKTSKKIIYILGSITILASPIYTMVSCGSKPVPPKPTPYIIDLSKVGNVNELITEMNSKMNFISSKPATWIGNTSLPHAVKEYGYPLSKNQYKVMGSTIVNDIPITLKYDGQQETVYPKLHDLTLDVQKSINNMLDNNWNVDGGSKAQTNMTDRLGKIMLGAKSPNITSYMGAIAKSVGIAAMGYLSIPQAGWDAYINELNAWNTFIWAINTSEVYKQWIKKIGNKYWLPYANTDIKAVNNYQYNDNSIFKNPSTINNKGTHPIKENNGINFDMDNALTTMEKAPFLPKPQNPDKLSNLEAQFAFRLQDLYGPNVIKD